MASVRSIPSPSSPVGSGSVFKRPIIPPRRRVATPTREAFKKSGSDVASRAETASMQKARKNSGDVESFSGLRRRKLGKEEGPSPICKVCGKVFKRPCDLTKHEKTHSRAWKCPEVGCKYHEYGWPTEKELDRHVNDKHCSTPTLYKCLFSPCSYSSKRESNCKQHMEKAHGWVYVRSKSNAGTQLSEDYERKTDERFPSAPRSNSRASSRSRTPLTPLYGPTFPNFLQSPLAAPPYGTDDHLEDSTDSGYHSVSYQNSSRSDNDPVLPNYATDFELFPRTEPILSPTINSDVKVKVEEAFEPFIPNQKSEDHSDHVGIHCDYHEGQHAGHTLRDYQMQLDSLRQQNGMLTPMTSQAQNTSSNWPESSDTQEMPTIFTAPASVATKPRRQRKRPGTTSACHTCRKRKIKCDETRPKCVNCLDSDGHCEGYAEQIPFISPPPEFPTPPIFSSMPNEVDSPKISAWVSGTYNPIGAADRHTPFHLESRSLSIEQSLDTKTPGQTPMTDAVSLVADSAYASASSTCASQPQDIEMGWDLADSQHSPKRRKFDEDLGAALDPPKSFRGFQGPFSQASYFSTGISPCPLTSQKILQKAADQSDDASLLTETLCHDSHEALHTPGEQRSRKRRRSRSPSITSPPVAYQAYEGQPSGQVAETETRSQGLYAIGLRDDSFYPHFYQKSRNRLHKLKTAYNRMTFLSRGNMPPNAEALGSGDEALVDVANSERDIPSDTEASASTEDTDFSEVINWSGHVLDTFREHVVKFLVDRLYEKLDLNNPQVPWRQCPVPGHTTGGSSAGAYQSSSNTNAAQGQPLKRALKRKANEREDGDEEDGGNSGAQPRAEPQQAGDLPERFLACPFCKFNPRKYRNCYKYELKEIKHVKQHLRRCHAMPIHCPVCYEEFETKKLCDDHVRRRCCEQVEEKQFECVSDDQRMQLEQRASKHKSKEENWYDMYGILFPSSPRPTTPYVEVTLSDQLCELREFVSTEAPPVINNLVQSRVPQHLRPQAEEIETFITQAVFPDAVGTLLERYELRSRGTPEVPNATRRTSTSATATGSEASPQQYRMPLQQQWGYAAPPMNHQPPHVAPHTLPGAYNQVPSNWNVPLEPSLNNEAALQAQTRQLLSVPPSGGIMPNLPNGTSSYQPETPDSGYRSGSAGNPGPRMAPTSSPYGFEGSFDTSFDEAIDTALLWPALPGTRSF
ncbi:MAG: copper-binding transcription factor [Bogoriella megaspora]|nr:MAG: copper-binding transcription factor [Bogoriella megaspora]